MADIAISEDSHDTNEREGERTPSLTRVSIGSASQLEAAPEVTGGAGAPGLPQGDQTRPCVIDQQQAPQANQAAAAEATNQPQTSPPTSDQPSDQPTEVVPESPLTSPPAAPAQAPALLYRLEVPGAAAQAGAPAGAPAGAGTAALERCKALPVPTTPTAPTPAPLAYLQRQTASAWREAQDAAAATYQDQVAAWEANKLAASAGFLAAGAPTSPPPPPP